MAKKLIFGVGSVDADYTVQPTVNGKVVRCPYYAKWHSMLERCYSEHSFAKRPTYIGCTVSEEWHSFVAFKSWMQSQDHEGKQLDKDSCGDGKVYSEETCVFISQALNKFMTDHRSKRGPYPIGVGELRGRFQANIAINGRIKYLGWFRTPEEAHAAWVAAKTQLAEGYIAIESDMRIIRGIRKYIQSIQQKKAEYDFATQAQLV